MSEWKLGGQTYSELIVFRNDDALNRFQNNKVEFTHRRPRAASRGRGADGPLYQWRCRVYAPHRA